MKIRYTLTITASLLSFATAQTAFPCEDTGSDMGDVIIHAEYWGQLGLSNTEDKMGRTIIPGEYEGRLGLPLDKSEVISSRDDTPVLDDSKPFLLIPSKLRESHEEGSLALALQGLISQEELFKPSLSPAASVFYPPVTDLAILDGFPFTRPKGADAVEKEVVLYNHEGYLVRITGKFTLRRHNPGHKIENVYNNGQGSAFALMGRMKQRTITPIT